MSNVVEQCASVTTTTTTNYIDRIIRANHTVLVILLACVCCSIHQPVIEICYARSSVHLKKSTLI